MTDDRLLSYLRALQEAHDEAALSLVADALAQEPPSHERETLEGTLRTLRRRAAARN